MSSLRAGDNLCSVCGLNFGNAQAFDLHRLGSHEYLASDERPGGRRCLTPTELRARGYWVGKRGRWTRSRYPNRGAPASLPDGAARQNPNDRRRIATGRGSVRVTVPPRSRSQHVKVR